MTDWTAYQTHFRRTLATAEPDIRREMERLGMAPFASDPDTTLRPADLMVVSMKPFGVPDRAYPCGWEERKQRPGLHRWYDGPQAQGNFVREADQLVNLLTERMALDLRPRQIFNTYAYFYRARDAAQLKRFGLDRIDCSEFHRSFLETVSPRVVCCIGNGPAPSAFHLYRELFGSPETVQLACAPRTYIKYARPAGGPLVIGLPHLSYARTASFADQLADLITHP
ncbi:uracil-DNA glycosylase family protein [Lewinella sp. JB7]|uniref:uracil-DNA glycosylase family protein n=1 Tax=Lewinella sp. JB7 TaxID=2962887 RepID=UPI0020C98183|nr:uracil-DNA glycosylase family protein [Lewinella sp. JB7]MCP9236370.1 uracil-DNA glycosylase family protein [Lewinella sp. JB7]